jgi:ABC-2 type transport system ATP-binding protein
MEHPSAVSVRGLRRDFGARRALDGVDLEIAPGRLFGLLGPNGGGKTTLFRILATLLPPTAGSAAILGIDVTRDPAAARERIGVVFQSPALDRSLTVRENLLTQGRLYGLHGSALRRDADALLSRFGLLERARDRVAVLSGGLRRRADVARALLHRPPLLLLDEPSTGLDPAARRDLHRLLRELCAGPEATVVLTTHLVDEAEACDELAILDAGRVVARGTPAELKAAVGGDVITIAAREPERLAAGIESRFGGPARVIDGAVRLERSEAHVLVPRLVEAFPDRIDAITVGRPTLLDVFAQRTGRGFDTGGTAA